ncbi:monocarboxylate transporter 12 [Biomphalaria pfeifferi]|uniref:Monocarboxylate transporter 12 n=1 Tax=Biomphalaria pfeifferi TaxID=112525 RepID=A0AAD8F351_BIOPF|nr:monocarboxylate transporter 12 [Biomphalaria pfeifferi]
MSIMFSVNTCFYCLATQVTNNFLLNHMTNRRLETIAAVINVMATLLFVIQPSSALFLTSSFVKATAKGTSLISTLTMVGHYFKRRRALGIGLALMGASFSSITVPPLTRYLRDEYGLRGCFLLVASLEMHAVLATLLLRPISSYRKRKNLSKQYEEALTHEEKHLLEEHPLPEHPLPEHPLDEYPLSEHLQREHPLKEHSMEAHHMTSLPKVELETDDISKLKQTTTKRLNSEGSLCSKHVEPAVISKGENSTLSKIDYTMTAIDNNIVQDHGSALTGDPEKKSHFPQSASESILGALITVSKQNYSEGDAGDSVHIDKPFAITSTDHVNSYSKPTDDKTLPAYEESIANITNILKDHETVPDNKYVERIENADRIAAVQHTKNETDPIPPSIHSLQTSYTNRADCKRVLLDNVKVTRLAIYREASVEEVPDKDHDIYNRKDTYETQTRPYRWRSNSCSIGSSGAIDVLTVEENISTNVASLSDKSNTKNPHKMTSWIRVIINFPLLKNYLVILIFCIYCLSNGGILTVMYLPSYARRVGIEPQSAAILLTVSGTCDMVSRVFSGLFVDLKIIKINIIMGVSLFFIGVVSQFLGLFVTLELLVMYSVMQGLIGSIGGSLNTVLIVETLGINYLSKVLPMCSLFLSISIAIQQLIVGALIEWTENYVVAFQYVGTMHILAAVLLVVALPLVKKLQLAKENRFLDKK